MTFHILGIVNPTDFHIFQRGTYTTNQIWYVKLLWHSFRAIPKFFVRRRVGRVGHVFRWLHMGDTQGAKGQVSKSINAHNSMFRLRYVFSWKWPFVQQFSPGFFFWEVYFNKRQFPHEGHTSRVIPGSRVTLQFTYCPTNPEFSGTLW